VANQLTTIGAKNAGLRSAVRDLANRTEAYTYDNLYRITGVDYGDGTTR
jgi:hypothetical protein